MAITIVVLFILFGVSAGALYLTFDKLRALKIEKAAREAELHQIQEKYRDVIDLDAHKAVLNTSIEELERLKTATQGLCNRYNEDLSVLQKKISLYESELTVIDCGHYVQEFDFDISQKYKDELQKIRERQKDQLKNETAASSSQPLSINGSRTEGDKQLKKYIRLMLRAFNGESDSIISNVKWNNVDKMIDRLEGVYQAINKTGESFYVKINREYFQLKLQELKLVYEYQEKLKAEKDEQKRIQQQIREEERAQKEIERAIEESKDEEKRFSAALARARAELSHAQGQEISKMNEKVRELEAELEEALAKKERAISRAQMTKSGHVYVISNIGSFGENRFKIGMTRRLEPLDRIYELGDASVPFEFDVHAMIFSNDAPKLEADLHQKFRHKSVNLVNERKEFFDLSIDEIIEALRDHDAEVEFVRVPEAKSYRQTLAIRSGTNSETTDSEIRTNGLEDVFLLVNGEQIGPVSLAEINSRISSGNLDIQSTMAWRDGMQEWIPLSQIHGISA